MTLVLKVHLKNSDVSAVNLLTINVYILSQIVHVPTFRKTDYLCNLFIEKL